jgi:apoptosis-inducing factor 2
MFSSAPNTSDLPTIIQARVVSVQPEHVKLDREWQGSNQVPFSYLAVATGARLAEPGSMKHDDKLSSVQYLRNHQEDVKKSNSVLIVGGGAVGIQLATDMKEYYPEKEVVVVHSREHLMPLFHPKMHDLVKKRFDELGIKYVFLLPIWLQHSLANQLKKASHRLARGCASKWIPN